MKHMHLKLLSLLDKEWRGLLLDAAAGSGRLSRRLAEMGYQVIGCDLYPQDSEPERPVFPYVQVDLNEGLPFKEGAFTCIVFAESIQYIDNYRHLLVEFSKVLKEGGVLIVSLPNVLSLSSRLSFLLRGYFPHFKPFRTVRGDRGWDGVIYNPVSLVELYQLLQRNAFEIEAVAASRVKPKDLILSPFYWLLKLGTMVSNSRDNAEKKALLQLLTSRDVLLGTTLVIRSRKVEREQDLLKAGLRETWGSS